jgi:hypothetical protein
MVLTKQTQNSNPRLFIEVQNVSPCLSQKTFLRKRERLEPRVD